MSGRGNVGAQYRGGRGGRGGSGLFDTYGGGWLGGGYGGQSGHGGFAGGGGFGGGGGGGRRPWQGGDGPMGHKWEDSRRHGRAQKNRARGRGGNARGGARGRARGRGQGMANNLNTWVSDQQYQNRESGAREEADGVNFDAELNRVRAEGAPPVEDGLTAVGNDQRDRLMHSRASQYEAAAVKSRDFGGTNLTHRDVQSLVDRANRTQPEGTLYNMSLRPVRTDGLVSSEAGKWQLYGPMLSTTDPFALDPDQEDEAPKADKIDVEVVQSPRRDADETMEQQHQKDAAQESNYEQGGSTFTRDPKFYRGA